MKKKFGVLLPAYNEEENIGKTLDTLDEAISDYNSQGEILVVDGGSDDRTAEIARKKGASVLKFGEKRGKGHDVISGLTTLLKNPSLDYFVIIDADGDYNPEYVPKFLEKLDEGSNAVFGYGKKGKYSKVLDGITGHDEVWGVGIEAFDRETTKDIVNSKPWDYLKWNIDALMTFTPYNENKEIERVRVDRNKSINETGKSEFAPRKHELLLGLPIVTKIFIHGLEEKLRSL